MAKVTAERYHDLSIGHRVVGHENKCKHLHGHNLRITFIVAERQDILDNVGRVVDFGVIKQLLCLWLEDNWDHKMLLWESDPNVSMLRTIMPQDIVAVPFNPTSENMAKYLVEVIGPQQLAGTSLYVDSVRVEETRKCAATYKL